jgi:hypothetical protein
MSVTTHIEHARTRVSAERESVDAKVEAFQTFIDRVGELPTEASSPTVAGLAATAGAQPRTEQTDDGCRVVLTAFAETVRPHSVADVAGPESLLETIRNELSDPIAVALAPTTETSFTAHLKRMVLEEARRRRTEAAALNRALAREASHLEDAGGRVDDVLDWLADADETPLTEVGFEELQRRHGRLATFRDRCDDLARERQAFLQGTTNRTADPGSATGV